MDTDAVFRRTGLLLQAFNRRLRRTRSIHRREMRSARLEFLERRELLAGHPLYFMPSANFTAGDSPNAVAVGDFNRDGWLDMATVNELSNNVTVLLGNGDGTFQAPRAFATSNGPRCVAAGDLNGDGKLDLVTCNPNNGSPTATGNLSVLLGNGDGTFQAPVNYTAALRPSWLALADLNRDGKLDVVAVNSGSNNVSVLLGTGTGTLAAPVNYAVSKGPFAPAVGDFNGDGYLDLVVSNTNIGSTPSISILINRGNGTFASFSANSASQGVGIMAIGDFDEDGVLDIAAANSSGTVSIYIGNGNGTFLPRVNYAVGSTASSVAAGDLDGDGHLDLLVTNGNLPGQAFLLRGVGSGGFSVAKTFNVGAFPGAAALADFDRDGQLDIAVPNNGDDNVSVLLNRSAATHFTVTGPAANSVGRSLVVTVQARNGADEVDTGYLGAVSFTSSDSAAVLPTTHAFTSVDRGVHSFGVILNTVGAQTVTVRDAAHGSIIGTITIVATNAAPVPVADTATTDEDTAVSIDVLANDSDPDGHTVAIGSVTAPSHSTAVVSGGAILYTPAANFHGNDSFTYSVSDGYGGVASGSVTVFVASVNDAPLAADDLAATDEDAAVAIKVLANDVDVDGDVLTVSLVALPSHGTASVNADGSITYTPSANFHGNDGFTYSINDGFGGVAGGSVVVSVASVNDAPLAHDDDAATDEDTAVTFDVLANDSDVDGDSLSVSLAAAPSHGTAVVNADGTITYSPSANFHGDDAFTYSINDGHGGVASASVAISVAPINDPPTAADDAAVTDEDVPTTIDVLANDLDVDGDILSVSLVAPPLQGTAAVNADGSIDYTPAANFHGNDSFTYSISDGHGGVAGASVTVSVVSVNDAPLAHDDVAMTDEDTAVTFDVLSNDFDADGDALSVSLVAPPAHGTALVNADGTITYTPFANFHGDDSFTYSINDGHGGVASALVAITVAPVNDPPTAADDASVTSEDMPTSIDVLANDSDVDGDGSAVSITTNPAHGTAVVNADGTITYTPAANFNGADSLVYAVTDPSGASATATVTVTVTPVNDAPVSGSGNDAVTTNEDSPITIDVLGNDTDPDGDVLTIVGVTPPAHGSVVINANATITYTPGLNFAGVDTFTYTVSDAAGATATQTVTVTVNAINDPPTATNDSVSTAAGTAVTINVLANDGDADGDTLAVELVAQPAHGVAVVNADRTITYTPNAGFSGADVISYLVRDAAGATATASVSVTVATRSGTSGKVTGGGSLDAGVRSFNFDVDGQQLAGGLAFSGALEFQDKSQDINFKADTISLLQIDPDMQHAVFTGTGNLNGRAGYAFKVSLADFGEPGSQDHFRIEITGPGFTYDSDRVTRHGGMLDGGNIQVHKAKASETAQATSAEAKKDAAKLAAIDAVIAETATNTKKSPAAAASKVKK